MESSSWPESLPSKRNKAIQELINGHIITDKLREMIGQPEKTEFDLKSANDVVVQTLGMLNRTLSILQSTNLNGVPHNSTNDVRSSNNWDGQTRKGFEESIKTKAPAKTKRGCFKRRKNASMITEYTSTLIDDGHAWRKYGQKDILNWKHQRNYYRCSHKIEQGCQATKQVQKIDDEPSKYKITYYGNHTCNNLQRSQIFVGAPSPKDNSNLISFKTNTNNKADTLFSSIKHTNIGGFPSLSRPKHEQVPSSYNHTSWDPFARLSQIESEPMSMISGLNCEDLISSGVSSPTYSTHGYEINRIIGSLDYGDLLF